MTSLSTYDGRWKMLVIGPGPGPKNVLAERDEDGARLVVPYAVWKHRLAKSLSPSTVHSNHTTTSTGGAGVDLQVQIMQVAMRTTNSGRQIFDVSCSDGKTRAVWDSGLANAINAYAGSGATISVRVKVSQNGQYTNESITAFAPPGQALPPEGQGGGPGGGQRGGGRGSMSPQDKTRIARMGAQGSAATLVAALFQGAGPEAYDEAVALLDKLTVKLFKQAVNNGGDIETAQAQGNATVLQPGAQVGDGAAQGATVLPQAGAQATPQTIAAVVPGVVVGTQALPAGGAADPQAAADVQAQAASEQGDNIDWN